ncbi:UPF0261 domain protein [Lentinus tigrinus ALCF2SS1-7]|uniref:UPF0261 domain protein n=1 Tax=Lentinus tigrinus ALCF2SS1-7 TaxID=1328758 RepID=UPI001165DAFE|nr:UPF0261 domain protein [Lentinus tigrinus ALCF2SS1-7]
MTDSAAPCVVVLGTCDTKLDELLYVHKLLTETHHLRVKLVDVGRTAATHPAIAITQASILAMGPSDPSFPHPIPDVRALSRNDLITALSSRAGPILASLAATHDIYGIIALGGSGGSALAAGVFAVLPLGFPKLLVSTMAAGDVGPFVREADVAVMYSVVDIAGLNDILCPILENAAAAVAGMARAHQARIYAEAKAGKQEKTRPTRRIAITMFGVTTPAVTHAREVLAKYDCAPYVFHATGTGGRAMERLVSEGFFDGVLDLTTTELADELVGGVLSAGPQRLEAAARKGVPQVVSVGALDMVNFGPRDSVPEKWTRSEGEGKRKLYEHNPSVTLMRTTREECAQLGRTIAEKLRAADGAKAEVWLPRGGVSAMDVKGGPFEDREADEELFRALKHRLAECRGGKEQVKVVEREEDINNRAFVEAVVIIHGDFAVFYRSS